MCIIKPEQYTSGRDAKTTNPRKVVQRWIKLVMNKQDQKSPEMPENIAETLLQGSRKIDRMRKDINELVSMLRGLMSQVVSHGMDISVIDHSTDIKWEAFRPIKLGTSWDFRAWHDQFIIWGLDNNRHGFYTRTDLVEPVYRSLPALVNGLVKEFPGLYTKLAPFVSASKVQLPD